MKIVQFKCLYGNESQKIGVLDGDTVIDLNSGDKTLPATLVELLQETDALTKIENAASHSTKNYQLSEVKLLPPITKPDKVIGIALNYAEHCDEINLPYPKEPVVFSKYSSAIVGPSDVIEMPRISQELDWEVELAVVIGKKCKYIKKEDAFDYVFGYTIAQDLSVRDLVNFNGGQFLLAKSVDTSCPLGPWVVTKDVIPDPYNLKLKTWVNGVLKQNGNTSFMIHKIDKLVSHLSNVMTLFPGDVILTGTPSGVGFTRKPKEFLKPGDTLSSEIDKIGSMENKVIEC